MKKVISLFLASVLLVSCGATVPEVQKDATKSEFSVQVQPYNTFPKEYTVQKTGRLVGSSSVVLTAQGVGRVESILVKEGTKVSK